MEIDREIWKVITWYDFKRFIEQLKPMEAEAMWEAMMESDYFESKMQKFNNIRVVLSQIEDRLNDAKESYQYAENEYDTLMKLLKNEKQD